jgi:NAD(P)-dependent dehydrogenase (short-subunit alcohol dehydrogenase family)
LSNISQTRKVGSSNFAKEISMQSKTALILGANRRLGRAVLEAFVAAGWQVLAQARRPIENLPPRARQLGIDMSNTEAVACAARDGSIVVYAVNPLYTE